jgi:phosphatidylglycerophosphate synthase
MLERLSTVFLPRDASVRDLVRIPGLLSLSRLPLAALFSLTLGQPLWAIATLAAAAATDVLDGWYARRFHQTSSAGVALDAFTDKVFVLTVVLTLLVSGSLSLRETLLLGARDIGEIALAVRLRLGGRRLFGRSANVAGKIATVAQYAALIAVILGSDDRAMFIGVAAFAGILATISYWQRDADAATAI